MYWILQMYQNGIADMPWNLAQIFKWAKNFVKNLRGQVASSIEIIFPSFSETFFKKCNISSQMISTVQTIYDPPFCYNGLWILMGLSFSWWVGYNICRYWPFYSQFIQSLLNTIWTWSPWKWNTHISGEPIKQWWPLCLWMSLEKNCPFSSNCFSSWNWRSITFLMSEEKWVIYSAFSGWFFGGKAFVDGGYVSPEAYNMVPHARTVCKNVNM